MADDLIGYYEKELAFLRRMAGEFAKKHPKIAGRLRIGTDTVEDPHVSRLIEGIAFLNARTRRKIEDDFPELMEGILNVLYPQYLAPLPSTAIVRFQPQKTLDAKFTLERGTLVETEPVDGEECTYRTAYAVDLWPLEIEEVTITGQPIAAPPHAAIGESAACLRLTLKSSNPDLSIRDLNPSKLRFYLGGEPKTAFALYHLLLNQCTGIAYGLSAKDPEAVCTDTAGLTPGGFGTQETLFDYPASQLEAFQILWEYFICPQKFLFFDLDFGGAITRLPSNPRLHVFFYLKAATTDLMLETSADNFHLFATPMTNLYAKTAEPIRLNHQQDEYRVVADARRPNAHQVHSISRVYEVASNGSEREIHPLFSIRHRGEAFEKRAFWQATRRSDSALEQDGDLYLRFVDLDIADSNQLGSSIHMETICCNASLPGRLPYGGGRPRLSLAEVDGPIDKIACLSAPTPTRLPKSWTKDLRSVVSHLNLNHLSLADPQSSSAGLREILRLYNVTGSPENDAFIDAVKVTACTPAVTRVRRDGLIAPCRGVDIELELDEQRFSGNSAFLFASVLERFFALYATMNSFTRVTARLKDQEGRLKQWPPRIGAKPIL